jgi:hypothetical protein
MTETDRQRVIDKNERAFDGVARGEITLHETDVIDGCGSDRKRRKARKLDGEKRWQDVPASAIDDHQAALCFAGNSFRYYLAAYMVRSLRDLTSPVVDFTIFALMPDTNKPRHKWKMEHFSDFSPEQIQAVVEFLQLMAEEEDFVDYAKLALDAFWTEKAEQAQSASGT